MINYIMKKNQRRSEDLWVKYLQEQRILEESFKKEMGILKGQIKNLRKDVQNLTKEMEMQKKRVIKLEEIISKMNLEQDKRVKEIISKMNLEQDKRVKEIISKMNLEQDKRVKEFISKMNLEQDKRVKEIISKMNLEQEKREKEIISKMNLEQEKREKEIISAQEKREKEIFSKLNLEHEKKENAIRDKYEKIIDSMEDNYNKNNEYEKLKKEKIVLAQRLKENIEAFKFYSKKISEIGIMKMTIDMLKLELNAKNNEILSLKAAFDIDII